jgi:hypothetical protein
MESIAEPKLNKLRFHRSARTGQSLGEYALIGSLVAVVSIAVFMLVGQNFSRSMVYTQRDMRKSINASALIESLTPKSSYMVTLKIPQKDGSVAVKTFEVQTNLAAGDAAVTTGANGSTESTSEAKVLSVETLKEMGLTEEQAKDLITLSNQAHKMASILAIVEKAVVEANGSSKTFMNTSIAFDGKTYGDAWQLSYIIAQGGQEWTTFEDLLTKLQKGGATSDPVVNDYINAQVESLEQTVSRLRTLLYETTFIDEKGGSTTLASILGLSSSTLASQSASNICSAGTNTTDNGSYCFSLSSTTASLDSTTAQQEESDN